MTCREKLSKEHPEGIDTRWIGGCHNCPEDYGYLDEPEWCCLTKCDECWNREIPGTEEKEKKMTIYEKVFGANFDEGIAHANCPVEFGFKDLPDGECERTNCSDCWKRPAEGNEVIRYADNKPINESPHILDSGNRREFETGAVRDIQEGKGRCDLMPLAVLAEAFYRAEHDEIIGDPSISGILTNLYRFVNTGDHRRLVMAIIEFAGTRCVSLEDMFLEVSKHFEDGAKKYGENNWQKGIPVHCYIDSAVRHYLKFLRGDKDEPHDRAFVWNLMCCIWTCEHKPELNEYKKTDKE